MTTSTSSTTCFDRDRASLCYPASSCLYRLPAVLLQRVYSYLSPRELLAGFVQTGKTTHRLLTPACFSRADLVLDFRHLLLLPSSPAPSSCLSVRPLLSDCRLTFRLQSSFSSVRQLAALSNVRATMHLRLTDSELHSMLCHRTTRACHELELDSFIRTDEQTEAVSDQQPQQLDVPLTQPQRTSHSDGSSTDRKRRFDWTDIRLPAVTRLRLRLYGEPLYSGGAAFLRAHTAILQLKLSTLLVSVVELAALFSHPAALPHLSRFSLLDHKGHRGTVYDLTPLLTALATTVVAASGRVRPLEALHLSLTAQAGIFSTAALMPGLTRLQVNRARRGWLEEACATASALPQLQQLVVCTKGTVVHAQAAAIANRCVPAARDILPFLQSMASRPLRVLSICIGDRVTFTAAAMAELARCQQLRELKLNAVADAKEVWKEGDGGALRVDWRDAALFASFTPNRFHLLRSIRLQHVKLSAQAVAAIASAAPELHVLSVRDAELSCHPAVVCAMLGGYCEHIEEVLIEDKGSIYKRGHTWRNVPATDISAAYQSAVTAARRDGRYRPFTRLRHLHTTMCWCTPPSVWHALLLLLGQVTHLRCVANMASDDPLSITAVSYLSLSVLGADCLWPLSFARHLQQRSVRTGRYRYVTSHNVSVLQNKHIDRSQRPFFELTDRARGGEEGWSAPLRPFSFPFAAYQRSLSAERQAVLARWARGDFQAGDEQHSAAETTRVAMDAYTQLQMEERRGRAIHRPCLRPYVLYGCYQVKKEEAGQAGEQAMEDVDEDESESDDEEKASSEPQSDKQKQQQVAQPSKSV